MNIKKIIYYTFSLLLLLLLTGGCSNSEKTSAPVNNSEKIADEKKLYDPRELVTKEDAEVALGEPAREPEYRENQMGGKLCVYYPVKESLGKFIQISVSQDEGFTSELQSQKYTAAKLYMDTKAGLDQVQTISGIGDDAFWGPLGLHILKENVYITIAVGNTNNPENLEIAKTLAITALNKL
ncbi:hypothetical protein SPSYN_01412 [Sporotomaculum syntrophicum]|uniref:Uncharacterized protein n=1 Tax=Sporotomaculum syntrophicum TaxID=182264 RepID=A0A9D2WQW8_9FIRM|nr:hypothetical protein [Sporotomaculum syntrophicum]KAF1085276.1 hypothetical protein SPSYN_01412 [Sporotomaculum syntrophicum]